MTAAEFTASLAGKMPPHNMTPWAESLWWDAKGDWTRAHDLINELDEHEAMCVHAYLHRKEGADLNANYWYERCNGGFRRASFKEEWQALVEALVS